MTIKPREMRQRVDSCQQVIHDVSARLSQEKVHPRIVEQLQRLDELLAMIDHKAVSETDLARIEASTNQLMIELETLFSHQNLGDLYDGVRH